MATFIGIDLAWKTARNPSGAAVLRGDRLGARLEELENLSSDDSVAEFVKKHTTENTVVAIDGPLIIRNVTGMRPCEIKVSERYSANDAGCYPSNLSLLPNASSVVLAGVLDAQGFAHVNRESVDQTGKLMAEVYPHAGMVALWDLTKTIKYKRGPTIVKRSGLQEFRTRLARLYVTEPPLLRTAKLNELLNANLDDTGSTRLKVHEDRLDALFCAYLAYYFWYWGWERNELFGDLETGYILNPMLHKGGSGTSGPGILPVNVTHAQRGTGILPVGHGTSILPAGHGASDPSSLHAQTALDTSNLKPETDFPSLIIQAHALARPIKPSADCQAGEVGSIIVSRSGKIYSGICLDFSSSLGFCAEHAAIAEIAIVVAVDKDGIVLPPCGRCREMMWQLNSANRDALVILSPDRARPLHELLPER
jgi:predicted RNase H-like nuclease/cytidine deaminase